MKPWKKWLMLIAFVIAVVSCDKTTPESESAEIAEIYEPEQMVFVKELVLRQDKKVEAMLVYDQDDLKLSIGKNEYIITDPWPNHKNRESPPVLDLQVMKQHGRSTRIILVSAEHEDPAYGSTIQLWALEIYDNGYTNLIWQLNNEPEAASYEIKDSGDYYTLNLVDSWFAVKLDMDEQEYRRLKRTGQTFGTLNLSAPIDMMLDDIVYEDDILVRRKVIGEKPEWLHPDYVVSVYLARSGHIEENRRYALTGDVFYSSKDLHPDMTVELVSEDAESLQIRLTTNSKMDRASLSNIMTSNITGRSEVKVDIDWQSDKEAIIILRQLEDLEVIYFDWHLVKNWAGNRYHTAFDWPFVFRKAVDQAPFVVVSNLTSEQSTLFEMPPASQIQFIEQGGATKDLLITNDQKHFVLDPLTGNERLIPLHYPNNSYRHLVFYPDRLFDTTNYVIESLRQLYRYDPQGNKTLLWEIPAEEHRSIYGWAVSPNGNQIAILYSEDNFNGPYADLVVVNHKGELLHQVDQVGYYNKSDGIIPYVNMAWRDKNTLVVSTHLVNNNELLLDGSRVVTFHSNDVDVRDQLEKDAGVQKLEQDIFAYLASSPNRNYVQIHPSPDRKRAIYERDRAIWLYDSSTMEHRLLGKGHVVGWIDEHHAIWYENFTDWSPLPTFIF